MYTVSIDWLTSQGIIQNTHKANRQARSTNSCDVYQPNRDVDTEELDVWVPLLQNDLPRKWGDRECTQANERRWCCDDCWEIPCRYFMPLHRSKDSLVKRHTPYAKLFSPHALLGNLPKKEWRHCHCCDLIALYVLSKALSAGVASPFKLGHLGQISSGVMFSCWNSQDGWIRGSAIPTYIIGSKPFENWSDQSVQPPMWPGYVSKECYHAIGGPSQKWKASDIWTHDQSARCGRLDVNSFCFHDSLAWISLGSVLENCLAKSGRSYCIRLYK